VDEQGALQLEDLAVLSTVQLTPKEERGLKEMYLFSVLVYIQAWMMAPCAAAAPRNDMNLMNALLKYRTINTAISKATTEKLQNHMWYLSEDLVGLAFLDKKVPITTKRLMLEALKQEGAEEPLKRPRPELLSFEERGLESFVSKHSKLLFERLELSNDFLAEDPDTWESRNDYLEVVEKIGSLKVVNDFAERGVARVVSFCKLRELCRI
jgi:hypothetical protein